MIEPLESVRVEKLKSIEALGRILSLDRPGGLKKINLLTDAPQQAGDRPSWPGGVAAPTASGLPAQTGWWFKYSDISDGARASAFSCLASGFFTNLEPPPRPASPLAVGPPLLARRGNFAPPVPVALEAMGLRAAS